MECKEVCVETRHQHLHSRRRPTAAVRTVKPKSTGRRAGMWHQTNRTASGLVPFNQLSSSVTSINPYNALMLFDLEEVGVKLSSDFVPSLAQISKVSLNKEVVVGMSTLPSKTSKYIWRFCFWSPTMCDHLHWLSFWYFPFPNTLLLF